MKKSTIVLLLLFTITPIAGFAQIHNYGIKLGVQSAGAYSSPSIDGRVAGFSVYGFTDWEIAKNFFSTINLGFTQQGFKNPLTETTEQGEFIKKVEATTKLSYISLSPIFNIDTKLASLHSYIGIGPSLDLLVHKSRGTLNFSSTTVPDPTAKYLDNIALGGNIVVGVRDLSVQDVNFRVEAKYEIDITDSFSKFPRAYRNNVFMLALGINL